MLGRRSYPNGQALVFEHCSSVHTWFMSMPIDIAFVDRDWRVLEVHENIGPWRTVHCVDAYAVIEMSAGEAEKAGLRSGISIQ